MASFGSQNNFFELGGHSLLTTQVVRTFQWELPLRILFQTPTIVSLAAQLDKIKITETLQISVVLETTEHEELTI